MVSEKQRQATTLHGRLKFPELCLCMAIEPVVAVRLCKVNSVHFATSPKKTVKWNWHIDRKPMHLTQEGNPAAKQEFIHAQGSTEEL